MAQKKDILCLKRLDKVPIYKKDKQSTNMAQNMHILCLKRLNEVIYWHRISE